MSNHEHTAESSGNIARSESKNEHSGIFKKIFHHHENKDDISKSDDPSTAAGFIDPGPSSRLPDLKNEKNHESQLTHHPAGHNHHAEIGADNHDKKRERNRLHKEPPNYVKQQWYEERHSTDVRTNQPNQHNQGQYQPQNYATHQSPTSAVASSVTKGEREQHGEGHEIYTEHTKHNQNKAHEELHPHHSLDAAIIHQPKHAESSNATEPQSNYTKQAVNQDNRRSITHSEATGGDVGAGAMTFAHHYQDRHVANTTQQPTQPQEPIISLKHNETAQPVNGPVTTRVGTGGIGYEQDRKVVNEIQHPVSTQLAVATSQPITNQQPQSASLKGNHDVVEASTATAGAIGVAGLASHHRNVQQSNTLDASKTNEELPKVPATDGKFMDGTPSTFNINQSADSITSGLPAPEQPAIASSRTETNTIAQSNALKQSTDFKQPDDLKQPTYFERPVDVNQTAGGPVGGLSRGGNLALHTGDLTDAFSPGLEGVNMPGKYPKKA